MKYLVFWVILFIVGFIFPAHITPFIFGACFGAFWMFWLTS